MTTEKYPTEVYHVLRAFRDLTRDASGKDWRDETYWVEYCWEQQLLRNVGHWDHDTGERLSILLEPSGTGLVELEQWERSGQPPAKAKQKRGRRTDSQGDEKIAREYYEGLEERLWEGQADYLRQKHRKLWRC